MGSSTTGVASTGRGSRRAVRVPRRWTRRSAARAVAEAGMTTAEYAVGTVAACGFGGVLYKILTSTEVMSMLKGMIAKAFGLAF